MSTITDIHEAFNDLLDSVNAITDQTGLKIGHVVTCKGCDARFEKKDQEKYCHDLCEKRTLTATGQKKCNDCGRRKEAWSPCAVCFLDMHRLNIKQEPGFPNFR